MAGPERYNWAPHERPAIPGSAATPDHAPWRRILYGLVGVVVGVTGGLGAAVVTVNLPVLQGAMGLTPVEGAWLSTAYVMASVCASMILYKTRQQFGVRFFAEVSVCIFALLEVGNLLANGFRTALAMRAASGFVGAGLSSLGTFYVIQALPARHRMKALAIGLNLSSFGIPLARIYSAQLIQLSEWHGLHVFELGMALVSCGAVMLLQLPPSDRSKAFEPLDILSLGLFVPGMALLCATLGLGRIVWWTEAPWIGWALCGAVVLITAAFVVESNRENPLLHLRWLAGSDMVRMALVSVLLRVILSEQTYGVVGLLQAVGVGYDQLGSLYGVIILAILAGVVASGLTIDPETLRAPVLWALALMAVGGFLGAHASNLTRPVDTYVSQGLLAFAATLFMAPAMLFGLGRIVGEGHPERMASFIMIFSGTQNLGGLAGTALLGTVQVWRTSFHLSQIGAPLVMSDPTVAARLQTLSGVYGRVLIDPALRQAEGAALLAQQATREANILAYNDVSLTIAAIAVLTFIWVAAISVRAQLKARRAVAALAAAPPASGLN
jgi:MFS family permease